MGVSWVGKEVGMILSSFSELISCFRASPRFFFPAGLEKSRGICVLASVQPEVGFSVSTVVTAPGRMPLGLTSDSRMDGD
jgi:hypothetical protein